MGFLDGLQKMLLKFGWLRQNKKLDPNLFGHPLALKTEWIPLAGGGANFKTRYLSEVRNDRIEFRGTFGSYFLALIFLSIGGGMFFFALAPGTPGDSSASPFFVGLVASIFFIIGCLLFAQNLKAVSFDLSTGKFQGSVLFDPRPKCSLHEIAALQIIHEQIKSKNSSFRSYELNLVLRNGQRLNVVDHGDLKSIREDAQILARFLGYSIAVWDATLDQYYVAESQATKSIA